MVQQPQKTARAEEQSESEGSAGREQTRERRLFDSLLTDVGRDLAHHALPDALENAGLKLDDPRLAECMKALALQKRSAGLSFEQFREIVRPNLLLVERALQCNLVIPDFEGFVAEIERIYTETERDESGAVADYIPQLGRVDPDQFAAALCTVDGQRFSIGDKDEEFCVQSVCKPINYCLALEDRGEEKVHEHVGREPSGHSFNELSLNSEGRPHNPMINSGAIMCAALIRPDLMPADRFDYVMNKWKDLSGGTKPGFSNPTYLSERRTADRNYALGYFMREHGAFPEGIKLVEILEFYFQCCALEITARTAAVVAGTLANGGICPTTGDRVLSPHVVQKCLSLMYSCGMYDFSGEWAFSIGLPAKSGVAGAVLVVVPNVMGLCIWSPRLDTLGNSVRGIGFCRQLIKTFNLHNYDNLAGGVHDKKDPRLPKDRASRDDFVALCWAASQGDLTGMRGLVARGVDLATADYDGRTALHLAASEGHAHIVEFLLAQGVATDPTDRWGGTPLDDAEREGRSDVLRLLK